MFSSKSTSLVALGRQFAGSIQTKCMLQRHSSNKAIPKFYKRASIAGTAGKFEINLDNKKLKTPGLSLFQVPNEALAMAVAQEWNSQVDTIKRHQMHLTILSNTAIDNPTRRSRDVVMNHILEFLDTDTILYRADSPSDLVTLQNEEWGGLINWLKERYLVQLEPTEGIATPEIPESTMSVFRQHLTSFNDWALVGYLNAVDILKSLVITMAVVDRKISVEKAVSLSRLEQEYQIAKWGNVEWSHDVDLLEQRARLAAAVMFIHFNSMDSRTSFNKAEAERPV